MVYNVKYYTVYAYLCSLMCHKQETGYVAHLCHSAQKQDLSRLVFETLRGRQRASTLLLKSYMSFTKPSKLTPAKFPFKQAN